MHIEKLTRRVGLVGMTIAGLACATVLWTIWDSRQAAWRAAEQAGSNLSLSLDRDVERIVASLDLSLRAAAMGAELPGLAQMPDEIRRSILFDNSISALTSGGMYVIDAAGKVLYASVPLGGTPIYIGDRDYFQTLRDNPAAGLVISKPVLSRANGHSTLPVARRISGPHGEFAGVVVSGLEVTDLRSVFSAFQMGKDSSITLASSDGTLLVRHPGDDRLAGERTAWPVLASEYATAPSGSFRAVSGIDGIDRLYAYRQIGTLPLIVLVGRSTGDILAEWRHRSATIGVALLLLLLLGTVLATALQRELRARRAAAASAIHSERLHAATLARLETLFNHSSDAMLVGRIEPDGRFVYEAVNPVWEGLAGVSAAKAIGHTPHDCLPRELANIIMGGCTDCVQERRIVSLSYRSADRREWDSTIVPIADATGHVGRLIGISRDVTRRNQAEIELRQFHRMEAVGQLTAGVAHDFNNLLQAILAALEVVSEQDGLDAEGRDCLAIATRSGQRCATLAHRLLAFSGKQRLDPELVDPDACLETVTSQLSDTLNSRFDLRRHMPDMPWPVRADAAQLRDCLASLISNACDAMPGGGTLDLSVVNIVRDGGQPASRDGGREFVGFVVKDSGVGIAPAMLERVFEPFFTTKTIGAGTGLGLSMVRGFARQSGGDLHIESAVGRGTSATLFLPRAISQPVPAASPAPPQSRRVLLVDDEAGVRAMMALFLRKAGLTVIAVDCAETALDQLRSGGPFGLLVTDQSMPGMSGCALIAAAARVQPALPAMLVTGYDKVDGLDALSGQVIVLRKPFERRDFLRHVQSLLGASPPNSQPWPLLQVVSSAG